MRRGNIRQLLVRLGFLPAFKRAITCDLRHALDIINEARLML